MKACVFTLGCKVNEVESEKLMASLETMGFEATGELCLADLYILNTCAVTSEAEKKSRQLIARARKFSPSAPIYICGCASQKDCAQFEGRGVRAVFGASDKERVLFAVAEDFGCPKPLFTYPKRNKTRAFVKVQDGCNNFCSYCIIPYLRGRESSRPVAEIKAEIGQSDGYEVVLTGINLSAYDKDGEGLEGLVRALKDVKKRIRLGSLECNVITPSFLNQLKGLYDFAPQFHLSLQSGSDSVLKAMNRHYTRAQFLQKCKDIYSVFPDAAITTDIIAGFAGETEEDFESSLSIISEAGISRVHAFAYSPREGTAAYKLKDLPAAVKRGRLKRLVEAGRKAESAFIEKNIGKKTSVVAEEYDGKFTCGYTPQYIRAYIPSRLQAGGLYNVILKTPCAGGAIAELTDE